MSPFINDNNIITNKNKINIINIENKNINGNIYEIRKDLKQKKRKELFIDDSNIIKDNNIILFYIKNNE